MSFPKFSIITPCNVHSQERLAQLYRAIDSVKNQTYSVEGKQDDLWEHIIINDGSPVEFTLPDYPWIKRIDQPHLERMIADNRAFEQMTGDWVVLLDSDDCLSPYYLEACADMINKFPDYEVFNFGSIHFHPTYFVSCRGPFRPKELEKGHEVFGSGNIVKGTFIFSRECYDKLGGFPETTNPWDFSAKAQEEYPELKQFFTIYNDDNKNGVVKEMGNPVGDDFYYFFKLTREYHSKPIEIFLYLAFHKGQRELRI